MVTRSRGRRVLRKSYGSVEFPGELTWYEDHLFAGEGLSPELARAAYEREFARMTVDCLELVGDLAEAIESLRDAVVYRVAQPGTVSLRLRERYEPPPPPPDAFPWKGPKRVARPRTKPRPKPRGW